MTRPRDVRFLGPQDREWPVLLRDASAVDAAPVGLWVRGAGDLGELLRRAVVVLGSVSATPYAVRVAHRLSAELAVAGWTVVTHGGFGVASAARHGVYSVGRPAVVLPSGGVARPTPVALAVQYARVTWTGLLVSESYRPVTDDRADRASRSRLLAVLGAAVILVEPASVAAEVGRVARGHGRPVFAVPGLVTADSGSSCAHRLIRAGTARLVTDTLDVLADLRAER